MNAIDIMESHRLIKTYIGFDKIANLPDEHIPHIVEGLKIFDKYVKICGIIDTCRGYVMDESLSMQIHDELKRIKEVEKQESVKQSFTKRNQLDVNNEQTFTTIPK